MEEYDTKTIIAEIFLGAIVVVVVGWVLISLFNDFKPRNTYFNPNIVGDYQPDSGREN